jgi:D-alanyl-D-alanine dipeptidase
MKSMKSAILLLLASLFFVPTAWSQHLPHGFVYVEQVIPDVQTEVRYFTADNFVGKRIEGYLQPRCILTKPAAEALKRVQEELRRFGLGLKIYDAYRPKQAVSHFVRWAGDLQDTRMKCKYYPDVDKRDLFSLGYIADKSSHSRGSTVDLTIVSMDPAGTAGELDMGTGFDLFSPKSWPTEPSLTPSQRAHRMLLQVIMKLHGFEPYPQEWWHFTLKNEPFPDTYFDFPVQ